MIRFNVNGEYLELPENFSLQFQKKNVLFAFDKMECERSTSFDIPATPTNDRIFKLAKWTQAGGEGMRRRYAAQMQASMVTKDGYLYLDAYSGGKYKAIFVTGELLGLQEIRDLGNIDECGIFDDYTDAVPALANPYAGEAPRDALNTLWENVQYQMQTGTTETLHPSINVAMLLHEMGIRDRDNIISALNLRWIPKKMEPVQDDFLYYNINFKNTHSGGYTPLASPAPNVSEFTIEGIDEDEGFIKNALLVDGTRVLVKYQSGSTWYHGNVVELKTKYTTRLYFTNSIPRDCFLGYFTPQAGVAQDYANLSDFHFLGGWEFDENGNETGSPLGGRPIILPPDTYFCIIRKSWWSAAGWNISTPDFEFQYNGILFEDFQDNPPAIWRLVDNLPSCTAIDLLKACAAMSGCVLYYTESDGVVLDWLILDGERLDLTGKVISTSDVSRKFSDYAQHNYVRFAEDETQYISEIERNDYRVYNDNLEASKTLLTLPAGNGSVYEDRGGYKVLMVRDAPGADIFACYDSREPLTLCRATLVKCDDVQALCDASTSISVKARLSLLEYERIQPKTQIYYDGVLYVWTEAQYSKDVVTLKLSKIHA